MGAVAEIMLGGAGGVIDVLGMVGGVGSKW